MPIRGAGDSGRDCTQLASHIHLDADARRAAFPDTRKVEIAQGTAQQIADAVDAQNSVSSAGLVTTADDRLFVRPSGQFQDIDKLADTLIPVNGKVIRLGDIAAIHRGYTDPASEYMRFGGGRVGG